MTKTYNDIDAVTRLLEEVGALKLWLSVPRGVRVNDLSRLVLSTYQTKLWKGFINRI